MAPTGSPSTSIGTTSRLHTPRRRADSRAPAGTSGSVTRSPYVHNLAVADRLARKAHVTRRQRVSCPDMLECLAREAVCRGQVDQPAVHAEDRGADSSTQVHRIPRDRVEDALEVRGRGGDGAQDLRRGGLLVAGLPERPLSRLRLTSPRPLGSAECEEGTAASATPKASKKMTRAPASAKRPSVRRAAASGPQARATHAARRVPGTRARQTGGRRRVPPHGAMATARRLGPVPITFPGGPAAARGQPPRSRTGRKAPL